MLTQVDHSHGRLLGTIKRLFGDASPLIAIVAAHHQGGCEAKMLSPFTDRSAKLTAGAGSFIGMSAGTISQSKAISLLPLLKN